MIYQSSKLITFSIINKVAFFASKMQASSTNNTKDSAGRRLGIKKFGGQQVMPNDIIARQRGFKWQPGHNVIVGKDQTIHAACEGIVFFRISDWRKVPFYFIDVIPQQNPNRTFRHPKPYNYHPQLFPERASNNHPPLQAINLRKVQIKQN